MYCQPKRHTPLLTRSPVADHEVAGHGEPVHGDQHVRAGHAEREEAAALLGDAAAGGYLSIEEMEARLDAVWAAATAAQLTAICSDLPPHLSQARAARRRTSQEHRIVRAALGPHLVSYLTVMGLLIVIWVLVGVSAGNWYPWPVWPALGWGIGLASHLAKARAT